MTSRALLSNLIKQNIKRRIWIITILLMLVLLMGPLVLITTLENSRVYLNQSDLINTMVAQLAPLAMREFFFTAVFALLIAFTGFSYVFSKSKLDLYHSLPIKREKLFMAQYTSGLVIQGFLMLLMLVSYILSALGGGYLNGEAWKNIGLTFIGDIVLFLFFYNVAVLAIILTGNLVVALLGTGVLFGIYPVTSVVFDELMNYCFVTHHYSSAISTDPIIRLYYLSPVSSYLKFITTFGENQASYNRDTINLASFVIVVIISCAIAFVLSLYLYKIRQSEAAGRSVAFKKSEPYIRIPIVILSGLCCSLVMGQVMTKYLSFWVWFALIFGCVITHFIMEMIFNIDYKAFYKNSLQMGICVVVSLIIFCIYAFDLVGYDRYIPEIGDIKEATAVFYDIDNDVSYIKIKIGTDGLAETDYVGRETFMYEHLFSDSEMINKVYSVAMEGLSHVDEMKQQRDEQDSGIMIKEAYLGDDISENNHGNLVIADPSESMNTTFVVDFVLKNGKVVSREYNASFDVMRKYIASLYDMPEYKAAHYDLYDAYATGAINKVEVLDQLSDKQVSLTNDDANKFMHVYLNDLKKCTVKDLSEPPVAAVNAQFMTRYGYEEGMYGYYIYSSFKDTLSYISSLNANTENMTCIPDPTKIQNISINSYSYIKDADSDEDVPINEMVFSANDPDGKKMIDLICNTGKLSNYGWSNSSFMNKEDRLEITAFYGMDGGIQKSSSMYFKKGQVPNELNEKMIEYAYSH